MRQNVFKPRKRTKVFKPRVKGAKTYSSSSRSVHKPTLARSAEPRPQPTPPEKTKTHGLTSLFCCFIAGMLLMFIFVPKEEFSGRERRSLASPPEFTVRTVFDGTFEDKAEDYVSDHFPFRLFFVGLNSYINLATGRNLINGVYVGDNEWFIQEPPEPDPENLTINMEAARLFGEAIGAPMYLMAVPSTGYVMTDELPEVHLQYNDPEIRKAAQEVLGPGVTWIDVLPALMRERAAQQVYYRTDHHWTTPGAYEAYVTWAEDHNFTPAAPEEFTVEKYGGFLGTTYAKVLLWGITPDEIELWQYQADVTVTTMDADRGMEPVVSDSFYDMQQIGGYDPYAVFFGGNHSVVRIENHDPNAEGRLLVVKDSYANSLLPFIARHYQEIVVLDPRYYRSIPQFLESEGGFDEVLFVYGISQLVGDQDLGLIQA